MKRKVPDNLKEKVIGLYREGISIYRLSRDYDICADSIRRWVIAAGVHRKKVKRIDDETMQKIITDYRSGLNIYIIGNKYNIPPVTVKRNLKKHNELRNKEERIELIKKHAPRGEDNPNWSGGKKVFKCAWCGGDAIRNANYLKTRKYGVVFCSKTCMGEYWTVNLTGKNNHNYVSGVTYGDYCEKFNKFFKKRVRAYWNNTCVVCGKTPETNNGRSMCVHHVYRNKQVCCDIHEENPPYFVTLCNACHRRADTDDKYANIFIDLIEREHNGKCYLTVEEWKEMRLKQKS